MGRESPTPIEIRLETVKQLFSSFDPSPFPQRDIDLDAERFIVDWARELPHDATIRIVIKLPTTEMARVEAAAVPEALANYFAGGVQRLDADLRELFRIGWRSLLIGVTVLTVSLIASQTLTRLIPQATLAKVIEESLIIVGWVANWRPLEIYLYDWWPIVRRRQLYRRLAAAPVEVTAIS
jgi:hypothetical protein